MVRHTSIVPARRTGRLSPTVLHPVFAAIALLAVTTLPACGAHNGGLTSASAPSSPSGRPAADAATVLVPPAAVRVTRDFWRLIDRHRYADLLPLVTPDSQLAAGIRSGAGEQSWGIRRVRVVSVDREALPAPPEGASIEFSMIVDITPSSASPWSAGRNTVFMSMRRIDGAWRIYESGTGP